MAAIAFDPLPSLEGFFQNPFEGALIEKVVNSEYFVIAEVTEVTKSFELEDDHMAVQAASRMDLFVSIGLPVLVAAGALIGGAWMMYTRLDEKIDAQVEQVTTDLKAVSETLRVELGADRRAFTDQLEKIRSDMRSDRSDAMNRHMEILTRLPPKRADT